MTTLRKVLPFLLICAALFTGLPLAAQNNPDCSFTHQFTGNDATWTGVSNLSGNTPCVNWRVTFSATLTLTTQITFQTSPDGSTWTAVPNNICSASVQPPCILQGTNPTAAAAQGMIYLSLYGNYVRVITSGSAGAGTATVRGYGAKGATAAAPTGGGGGSGTVTNTGALTANAIVTGNGGVDIKTPSATSTLDASGNVSTPGTLSTGVGSGASGAVTLNGSASGSATVQAAAAQGTPNAIQLPLATGSANQVLATNGANPQQLSWVNQGTASPGATFFSATDSTTATAATPTSLIGTVTGSTTIPANTFTVGSVMAIMAQGHFTTPMGPRTLTINLLIGGSSVLTTGAMVPVISTTNGTWQFWCIVTTRTIGVTGTQIANCFFQMEPHPTSAASTTQPMPATTTWTVNTTGTLAIDLQATWDATTGAPSVTSTNIAAWIPGAGSGGGGSSSTGSITALPAPGTAGAVYYATDSLYETIRDNGVSWDYFYRGAKVTPPNNAIFSLFNNGDGDASVSAQTNGVIVLSCVSVGNVDNVHGYEYSAPATPWTQTFRFKGLFFLEAFEHFGIYLRESATGKLTLMEAGTSAVLGAPRNTELVIVNYTNPTTFASITQTLNTWIGSPSGNEFLFRISDDGSNLSFSFSVDNGISFYLMSTVAVNSFFTTGPDKIGIGVNPFNQTGGLTPVSLTLISVD